MKLFIGCSSSDEISKKYMNECEELLNKVFEMENELVFGANNTGLMGLAYDIALKHGRCIIGVCPQIYQDDLKKLQCTKEIITKTVSERTEMAMSQSDALIFLPGGIGTIYELLTAIETKRGHEHDKPIIIFNSNGYFNQLLTSFEKVYDEHFTSRSVEKHYTVAESIHDVLTLLTNVL